MTQSNTHRRFHTALHRWYAEHGRRDLPWRNTRDPYPIYLSEIMLQQTQVKTVLERFYHPFLARFPSLQALADAPREAVLKQWEGLGYYNRAANLHKAAQAAAPALPDTVEALEALPGIGRNTAHAVAAFAFGRAVPVMEANLKRVLCRIYALENPKGEELWDRAFALLDGNNPFDYNQAMMDIGAMVCTKRNPHCGECPAEFFCKGKTTPEAYPQAKQKKATPVRRGIAIIWEDAAGRLSLAPREGAFLRGLYGFSVHGEDVETLYKENTAYALAEDGEFLGEVSQTYSHFQQVVAVWRLRVAGAGQAEDWYSPQEIAALALSGIDHKIWELAAKKR